ncbi:uncharacterized protein LOC119662625 [Teleopsis dalmanni]|uniref:uncharacterized protein LOC119662625 n=1 Tax=Teleopsis dalmanni TaxID=139649 RepID=UPI000D32B1F5|nr:uncharacterized protein LOC119662625 [Teleopsis dalmanni]
MLSKLISKALPRGIMFEQNLLRVSDIAVRTFSDSADHYYQMKNVLADYEDNTIKWMNRISKNHALEMQKQFLINLYIRSKEEHPSYYEILSKWQEERLTEEMLKAQQDD